MRRPILRGDRVAIEASVGPASVDGSGVAWVDTDVRATVGGELRSSLTGRFAVPAEAAPDVWALGPGRWHP